MKRKICFVLTSKIHYSRSKLILEELKKRDDVDLQIVVGASAILKWYGDVEKWLKDDGFEVAARITMSLEGGSTVAMAKTAGLGLIEFASVFENLKPDLVVLRGDRYEVLSAAVAAAYMNCPIAHIEGGDISGTIDEAVRHAITKLSHIHFATNEDSRNRILRMGERPEYVYNVGAPDVEFAARVNYELTHDDLHSVGVGGVVDITKEYMIVMQHPVTTETEHNRDHMEETLYAVLKHRKPSFIFWPNNDAGTDKVSNAIRRFREKTDIDSFARFITHLPAEKFIALLKKARVLVGNSSSGVKECSYLGVPVVNIGTRQAGRKKLRNVMDVAYHRDHIADAIEKQWTLGKHEPDSFYYKPDSSKKIAETIATAPLYIQKQFYV